MLFWCCYQILSNPNDCIIIWCYSDSVMLIHVLAITNKKLDKNTDHMYHYNFPQFSVHGRI